MFFLKLALRPFRLAPRSQLLGVLTVAILFFLAGFLFFVQSSLSPVLRQLSENKVLIAYLESEVPAVQEKILVDTIRMTLGAAPRRNLDVTLMKSAGFIERIKEPYPELATELYGLGAEVDLLVPRYVHVSGFLPQEAKAQLESLPGIESVESSDHRFRPIIGAFLTVQWGARLLLLGLAIVLVSSLVHLGRMNAHFFSETFALLKLWGADPLDLRIPGILSGTVVGLTGGLLAGAGWVAFSLELANHFRSVSPVLMELAAPAPVLGIGFVILGALAGSICGFAGGMVDR